MVSYIYNIPAKQVKWATVRSVSAVPRTAIAEYFSNKFCDNSTIWIGNMRGSMKKYNMSSKSCGHLTGSLGSKALRDPHHTHNSYAQILNSPRGCKVSPCPLQTECSHQQLKPQKPGSQALIPSSMKCLPTTNSHRQSLITNTSTRCSLRQSMLCSILAHDFDHVLPLMPCKHARSAPQAVQCNLPWSTADWWSVHLCAH